MTDKKESKNEDATTKLTLLYQGSEPGADPKTGDAKFRVILAGEMLLDSAGYKAFLERLDEDMQINIQV